MAAGAGGVAMEGGRGGWDARSRGSDEEPTLSDAVETLRRYKTLDDKREDSGSGGFGPCHLELPPLVLPSTRVGDTTLYDVAKFPIF